MQYQSSESSAGSEIIVRLWLEDNGCLNRIGIAFFLHLRKPGQGTAPTQDDSRHLKNACLEQSNQSTGMTVEKLAGSCLCGTVTFEIKNEFEQFQLCHCTQCQKTTGSAHASNLFTSPKNITWQSGQDSIIRYDVEGRRISNSFCNKCGSRLPFTSLSGELLAVPAGSLDGVPSISPQANIFWPERAQWYDHAIMAKPYDKFIE